MKATLQALFITIFCFVCAPSSAQMGTWRNYLAYSEPQQIAAASGNDIFVLASNGLYQYNTVDGLITTYDKVSGMNGVDITNIAWNKTVKRLIATYSDSNIDMVDTDGNIINISDLYNKTTTDDKTINSIYINNRYAYLSTNFGIVKVDMQRAEISETYNLQMQISDVAISGGSILARTISGIVLTATTNTNLQDPANWQPTTDFPATIFDHDLTDWNKYIDVVRTLKPGGPKYNYFCESKFNDGKLYTTGGYFLSGVADYLRPGTVQVWNGNEWQIYEEQIETITGYEYLDNNCIDYDPTDNSHVAVGGRCGLYEFKDGKLFRYYNQQNSPIRGAMSGATQLGNHYNLINGLKYDSQGNLWVLNSQAKGVNLLKLTKDGEWIDAYQSLLAESDGIGLEGLKQMTIDSRGLLWFVNSSWKNPALFCYNIDNNKLYKYTDFTNQDGTKNEITSVYCTCEDLEGNIWVGTNVGAFLILKNEVGQEKITFQQIKVPRNDGTNYADYLMSNVSISNIVIDGGNRKWFGTNDMGVFLISADNMTQLEHFTIDNSGLLSNSISSIEIDGQTGEVFFLTSTGLCSYISNVTQAAEEMTKDNVYAYPNPVTPDYNGLVTITGLSYNADVKIVTVNGVLVAQGRSNGGAFTWDCNDLQGKRVVSGIYMVMAATEDGNKGTVCKIAVIN
ncbi:MAG: T9SS type A sorting domain-containing protein [Prevotella sp.]|nr:T9SS type A sorting domain-containing protein [Prevotella sp.]